jgi:hypothetical protein
MKTNWTTHCTPEQIFKEQVANYSELRHHTFFNVEEQKVDVP